MVPDGWKRLTLQNVAEIRSGVAKGKTGLKDPIVVPYLRVANVQDGHIDLKEVKNIEIERHQLERYVLQYGDVLMNEGGDFDKLGRGDVWQDQIRPCIHQNHVFAVRPDHNKLDSFFLAALAASNYGKTYFLSCAKRSTNLASINSSQIKEFPILLPPLVEQKKIAQILSTWDKAITTTEKLLANSEQQKKALMQQLLTGKMRFPGFNEDWKEKVVSDFGNVITGSTPLKSVERNYGGSICWATAVDFKSKYINDTQIKLTEEGALCARILPEGSVLITCIASIGKNAIAKMRMGTNQQINAVIINAQNSNEYFYYLMEFHKKSLIALAGTTAVPILNKSNFEKFKVKTPSFQEQKKIAYLLSNIDAQGENINTQLVQLKNEKKWLMQQLLTGKRRICSKGLDNEA